MPIVKVEKLGFETTLVDQTSIEDSKEDILDIINEDKPKIKKPKVKKPKVKKEKIKKEKIKKPKVKKPKVKKPKIKEIKEEIKKEIKEEKEKPKIKEVKEEVKEIKEEKEEKEKPKIKKEKEEEIKEIKVKEIKEEKEKPKSKIDKNLDQYYITTLKRELNKFKKEINKDIDKKYSFLFKKLDKYKKDSEILNLKFQNHLNVIEPNDTKKYLDSKYNKKNLTIEEKENAKKERREILIARRNKIIIKKDINTKNISTNELSKNIEKLLNKNEFIGNNFDITNNQLKSILTNMKSTSQKIKKLDKIDDLDSDKINGIIAFIHYVGPHRIIKLTIDNVNTFLNKELPFTNNTKEKKKIIKEHDKIKRAILRCKDDSNRFINYKTDIYYNGINKKWIEISKG